MTLRLRRVFFSRTLFAHFVRELLELLFLVGRCFLPHPLGLLPKFLGIAPIFGGSLRRVFQFFEAIFQLLDCAWTRFVRVLDRLVALLRAGIASGFVRQWLLLISLAFVAGFVRYFALLLAARLLGLLG